MLKEYISLYHGLLCPWPARLSFVWKAIFVVTVLFGLLASSLCFPTKGFGLTYLFLFFSLICPSPSPRMKVWRRSAWPVQVAFLVALVMLCVDPVSAGSRNHRGQTGTPRSWSEPFFQHLQRLITLSLWRYSTCSRVTPILEEQEEERGGLSALSLSVTQWNETSFGIWCKTHPCFEWSSPFRYKWYLSCQRLSTQIDLCGCDRISSECSQTSNSSPAASLIVSGLELLWDEVCVSWRRGRAGSWLLILRLLIALTLLCIALLYAR